MLTAAFRYFTDNRTETDETNETEKSESFYHTGGLLLRADDVLRRHVGRPSDVQKAFFHNLVAVAIAAVTVIKSGEGIVIREGCWPDLR